MAYKKQGLRQHIFDMEDEIADKRDQLVEDLGKRMRQKTTAKDKKRPLLAKYINPRDLEFDIIYVNGSKNLLNLRLDSENWKVRLMEEEFMKRTWDVEGV
jgi:hypothetical protein